MPISLDRRGGGGGGRDGADPIFLNKLLIGFPLVQLGTRKREIQFYRAGNMSIVHPPNNFNVLEYTSTGPPTSNANTMTTPAGSLTSMSMS